MLDSQTEIVKFELCSNLKACLSGALSTRAISVKGGQVLREFCWHEFIVSIA